MVSRTRFTRPGERPESDGEAVEDALEFRDETLNNRIAGVESHWETTSMQPRFKQKTIANFAQAKNNRQS
jgi:hypothetical protein